MEIVDQIFTGLFVTVVGGLIVGIALDKVRINKRTITILDVLSLITLIIMELMSLDCKKCFLQPSGVKRLIHQYMHILIVRILIV